MDRRRIRNIILGIVIVIAIVLTIVFYKQILGTVINIGILLLIGAAFIGLIRKILKI